MQEILVPISPGELLDKITILRIKSVRLSDQLKLANVRRELALLEGVWNHFIGSELFLSTQERELEMVNRRLWEIEDRLRHHELQQRFDSVFVELARSVYVNNDERAAIKKRINLALGSVLIEEKSYGPTHGRAGS